VKPGRTRKSSQAVARTAKAWLHERLAAGPPLLLDGALGTELERLGVEVTLPLWSTHALLRDPALVEHVHADYVAAGADVLTANTFRTQRRVLSRAGIGERALELTRLAVDLARRAARGAERRVFVVGSAPPLEDCYRPDLVPDARALALEHAEHAANLAAAGVDAILIETMNTAREAVAALRAARDAGLPCFVSFVCWDGAQLLGGEPLSLALAAAAAERPEAVLVNCLPVSNVAACLPWLRAAGLPFGVYANLGAPGVTSGAGRTEHYAADGFAAHAAHWVQAGARIVGGCCGTTPGHILAMAAMQAQRS
jgi:S-methylmethionine-dependent homocysteine/selenocysteine methylase